MAAPRPWLKGSSGKDDWQFSGQGGSPANDQNGVETVLQYCADIALPPAITLDLEPRALYFMI